MRDFVAIAVMLFAAFIVPFSIAGLVAVFMSDERKHRKKILLGVFLLSFVLQWGVTQIVYDNPIVTYAENYISEETAEQIVTLTKEKFQGDRWSFFVPVSYEIRTTKECEWFEVRSSYFPNNLFDDFCRYSMVSASELV